VSAPLHHTHTLRLNIALLLLVYSAAHNPASLLASLGNRAVLALILAMLVFPFTELFAMRRMIQRKLEEEGIWTIGEA